MEFRRGTAEEMLALWGGQSIRVQSPTAKFFFRNIESGNARFWLIERDGAVVGELYAFLKLEDADFADGAARAYLCAFSVRRDLRGQGLGTRLMGAALDDLRALGFTEATIGVDLREEANIRLYRRLGFLERVRVCGVDPCMLDDALQPVACPPFLLLKKDLFGKAK